jgi:hypothetical protein
MSSEDSRGLSFLLRPEQYRRGSAPVPLTTTQQELIMAAKKKAKKAKKKAAKKKK